MSKEKKVKAKKERKKLSEAEKAEKAAKYEVANENYRTINTTEIGKITITTQAVHVRGKGLLIREVSSAGSVSSTFIPGVKIKKKKEWLTIVEDKGPKVKKEKSKK